MATRSEVKSAAGKAASPKTELEAAAFPWLQPEYRVLNIDDEDV